MKTSILATLLAASLSSAAVYAVPSNEPQPILGEAQSSITRESQQVLHNTAQPARLDVSDSGYFNTRQGQRSERSTTARRIYVVDSGYFKTQQGQRSERSTTARRPYVVDSGYFNTKQGQQSATV